jgi:hypothetical protein
MYQGTTDVMIMAPREVYCEELRILVIPPSYLFLSN